MNFRIFNILLFLISIQFVTGQKNNKEKNDCTKLYNYLKGDSKDYTSKSCCNDDGIDCDLEGHLLTFNR